MVSANLNFVGAREHLQSLTFPISKIVVYCLSVLLTLVGSKWKSKCKDYHGIKYTKHEKQEMVTFFFFLEIKELVNDNLFRKSIST